MNWIKFSTRLPKCNEEILIKDIWGDKRKIVFNFAKPILREWHVYEQPDKYGMGVSCCVKWWKPYTERKNK